METIKGKTPNAIWNEYQENEDNNAHTDNVVLLAQFFGSKADLKKAWGIYKQHEMSGHATKSIVDERNKLSAKLFPKLVKAKNQMKNGGGVDSKYAEGTIDGGGYDIIGGARTVNELSLPELETQLKITKSNETERIKLIKKLIEQKLNKYAKGSTVNKYKNGGGIDINELNIPVIRTQFEDEEYEFKDGGVGKATNQPYVQYEYFNTPNMDDGFYVVALGDKVIWLANDTDAIEEYAKEEGYRIKSTDGIYFEKKIKGAPEWDVDKFDTLDTSGYGKDSAPYSGYVLFYKGRPHFVGNSESDFDDIISGNYKDGGGVREYKGLSNKDKFIADQLYYVISLKSISEKKNTIKNSLLPNINNYNLDEMTKKITKGNLEYALQQKSISDINRVLKTSINAFRNDKMKNGGGISSIKVGAKLGLLNPRNGRYKYSIIEKIEGENVYLVEKHPTRSQWDNHWETTKSNIKRFLNEDNEDFKSKKSYVLKYADGGGIDINELNMPVIRTQFEDEEYEFKDGGFVFNYDPNVDYFSEYYLLPKNIQKILFKKEYEEPDYKTNEKLLKELNKVGWTFEYDLSGSQYDLKPIETNINANGGTTKGFEYSIGGL